MEREMQISMLPNSPTVLKETVTLHQKVLADEFITRFGIRFLSHYYTGFAESPFGVVLIAADKNQRVAGALIGTLDAKKHYPLFTRRYGPRLAVDIGQKCLISPSTASLMIRTRLKRYIRGGVRQFLRRTATSPSENSSVLHTIAESRVGEITHLFVNPEMKSHGIGTHLVSCYESLARDAGVNRIDLVTAPKDAGGAGPFYEKLGWVQKGRQVSRSDEEFVLYEKWLNHNVVESQSEQE